jgi:hypothetical protein
MPARILPIFKTQTIEVRVRDRVAEVIADIDAGRIKGRRFAEAINDFTFDELERLSDRLIEYYAQKFR